MPAKERLSFTLPVGIARFIRDKVAAGEYANEREVVGDGLLRLVEWDRRVDGWLTSEAVSAYGALRKYREPAIAISDIREAIFV